MTRRLKCGTLSTTRPLKDPDVLKRARRLLGARRLRISPHANRRMAERGILYYEVLQALETARRDPRRDRWSREESSWSYSLEGRTIDGRQLRLGVCFYDTRSDGVGLLLVTVIDLSEE